MKYRSKTEYRLCPGCEILWEEATAWDSEVIDLVEREVEFQLEHKVDPNAELVVFGCSRWRNPTRTHCDGRVWVIEELVSDPSQESGTGTANRMDDDEGEEE